MFEGGAVRHDATDEPHRFRFGGGDVLAGEEDVGRFGITDLARETNGRATSRIQRPAHLGHTELRRFGGDTDIGSLEDLRTACDGDTLDGGDDRFGRPIRLGETLVDPGGAMLGHRPLHVPVVVLVGVAGKAAQVHTGAEVAAGTREHDATDVIIGRSFFPSIAHAAEHLQRHGVLALRTVHGGDHHVTALLDEQIRHSWTVERSDPPDQTAPCDGHGARCSADSLAPGRRAGRPHRVDESGECTDCGKSNVFDEYGPSSLR